jgi:hypothetical protein
LVRHLGLLLCLTLTACGGERARVPEAGTPADSIPLGDSLPGGQELIPAEWTVAEDTSANGEITTASLQLPSARDIAHLLPDESPRLILRCVDHRVAAYIDPDASTEDSSAAQPVSIQLDSAPRCE